MLDLHRRLLGRVPFADQDDPAAARRDLLHVGHGLLEHRVAGRDDDDRHVRVDQRDRPVLQLAGRVALGMDVAQLLQLQRALQRERIPCAAAEVEDVPRMGDGARELFAAGSSLSASARRPGAATSSARSSASFASSISPRALASPMASAAIVASWQVNALVEATPISGPASVGAAASVRRAMLESAR